MLSLKDIAAKRLNRIRADGYPRCTICGCEMPYTLPGIIGFCGPCSKHWARRWHLDHPWIPEFMRYC